MGFPPIRAQGMPWAAQTCAETQSCLSATGWDLWLQRHLATMPAFPVLRPGAGPDFPALAMESVYLSGRNWLSNTVPGGAEQLHVANRSSSAGVRFGGCRLPPAPPER